MNDYERYVTELRDAHIATLTEERDELADQISDMRDLTEDAVRETMRGRMGTHWRALGRHYLKQPGWTQDEAMCRLAGDILDELVEFMSQKLPPVVGVRGPYTAAECVAQAILEKEQPSIQPL